MCGIAGFWRVGLTASADDLLERINACLTHRGPDGEGRWTDASGAVGLGHRRLAIVDRSETGRQPMRSSSGRFVIVFKGEIYNFRALRRQLELAGHRFAGSSDTEVMLAYFERLGVAAAAVSLFSGVFAFAVFDTREEKLWLCRDRLGEKPLYIAKDGQRCVFASELKAILAAGLVSSEVAPLAIAQVLRHGCIAAPQTIYRDVAKLYPGEILCVERKASGTLNATSTRYWDPVEVARSSRESAFRESRSASDQIAAVLG